MVSYMRCCRLYKVPLRHVVDMKFEISGVSQAEKGERRRSYVCERCDVAGVVPDLGCVQDGTHT